MSFSSSAPARKPMPESPDQGIQLPTPAQPAAKSSEESIAYLRLLWEHRRFLSASRRALC